MPPPEDVVPPAGGVAHPTGARAGGRRAGRRSALESDATRTRILLEAGELFLRQGFAATTVRQIADAAEVTVPAIYHHFTGKQALLESTLAPLLDGMDAVLEGVVDGPVDRPALLGDIVEVLTREGPPVDRLFSDPSVFSMPAVGGRVRAQTDRLIGLLAPADASARTRVLVGGAVSALFAAARHAALDRTAAASPADRQWAVNAAVALLALADDGAPSGGEAEHRQAPADRPSLSSRRRPAGG